MLHRHILSGELDFFPITRAAGMVRVPYVGSGIPGSKNEGLWSYMTGCPAFILTVSDM